MRSFTPRSSLVPIVALVTALVILAGVAASMGQATAEPQPWVFRGTPPPVNGALSSRLSAALTPTPAAAVVLTPLTTRAPRPAAIVKPSPTATPVLPVLVVDTGGRGIELRAEPIVTAASKAILTDGTRVSDLGRVKRDRVWVNVRTAANIEGWVPDTAVAPEG